MPLIKNPNELTVVGPWAGLIYGEPGTGKSTLALSSPNPVMLDADGGMRRVQKRFQAPSLPMKSYQDVLDLLETDELDGFETIVPDTLGALVAMIGDWVMNKDPKNRKKDGSLALQGYGAINTEFARFVRIVKGKGKYLLFVAHGKEEKDGDSTKVRPDCIGSSGKELVKSLDFMGYIEMHGDDRRTISFSPTEKFYAKNSLGLKNFIEIPDPNKVGNVFIKEHIIKGAEQRALEEAEENRKYDDTVKKLMGFVNDVSDVHTATACLTVFNQCVPIWDSHRLAKHALNEKIKSLGIVFDKEAKEFKKSTPVQTTQTEAKPEDDKAPLQPNSSALVPGLLNGIAACTTSAELDKYLKDQSADFAGMNEDDLKKLRTAIDAKHLALITKPAEKAA